MPKKKRHCEHTYKEWDPYTGRFGSKKCPHPYFLRGKDQQTGKKVGCCIFHAPIEDKEVEVELFWEKFDELLIEIHKRLEQTEDEAEKKNVWLECFGFVFPDPRFVFHNCEFPFSINMSLAKFTGYTDFIRAVFTRNAVFEEATFSRGAADFSGAQLSDVAYFWGTEFSGHTDFSRAQFSGDAYFLGIQLSHDSDADFSHTMFSGNAYFRGAQFSGVADFREAQFSGAAHFQRVKFSKNAVFSSTTFEKRVSFRSAHILGRAVFEETEFLKSADFRGVITEISGERKYGTIVFDHTYYHIPNRVTIGSLSFHALVMYNEIVSTNIDLSHWSFRGTNIENVHFVEPCWPSKEKRRGRKKTLDEELAGKGEISWVDDEIAEITIDYSWAEAGEVYRKLRKNFEGNLAYEAAGDFHVGQMECRLRDRDRKLWDRGFTFAYKLVSGYGESVGRPLLWLLGFFAVFTGLFLVTGFPAADGSAVDWVWGFKGFLSREWWGQLWDGISFTLRSSVSFAVPRYAENVDADVGATLPFLMFFWKVFAVTTATFFVLALRRRFRR